MGGVGARLLISTVEGLLGPLPSLKSRVVEFVDQGYEPQSGPLLFR